MIKVATEKLKQEVARAIKGAGNNAIIPLTTMIGVRVQKNKLYLCTTDGTNDVQVIIDKIEHEDTCVTINAELFSKLISKMTSDVIELVIEDKTLLVKGNGEYKLPLIVDEEGLVEFPQIKFSKTGVKSVEVNLSTLKTIHNTNKSALATTYEEPHLTGYYMGERIITTDSEVACFCDFKLDDELEPLLMNPQMLNLLILMKDEKVKLCRKGTSLYFYTPSMIVSGSELEGLGNYPVNEIQLFLGEEFPSNCKVPKELLLSVLDRLQLFIEPYDKNGATFVFTKDGLQVSSMKSSSIESINYTESADFEPHTCLLDVVMLKEQVNAIQSDTIEIHYGNEVGVKLVSGKVTIVMSALEEE